MSKNFISIGRAPVPESGQPAEPLNGDSEQIRETVEQTRHDGIRTRQQLDRHMEKAESGFRRLKVISVVVILIALSLIGAGWYGYSYLNQSRSVLAGVPELRKIAGVTGDRITAM